MDRRITEPSATLPGNRHALVRCHQSAPRLAIAGLLGITLGRHLTQARIRGTQMAVGCVPMRNDEWVACEHCVHDGTLGARAAPVDESHETKPGLARGGQVRIYERRNFVGPERVQVEHVFDRDLDRVAGVITHVRLLVYSLQSTVYGREQQTAD